ncbi:PAS domain-containing protein [Pseudomonas capeferrum]
MWQRALSGEQFTLTQHLGNGAAQRHYELCFNCLRAPDGVVQGAYLFAHDISERVTAQQRLLKAEEALRHAQKMEAVGHLSGGIAQYRVRHPHIKILFITGTMKAPYSATVSHWRLPAC